MNREILKIIIKVLIYALGLIGTYFGIATLSSCSSQHYAESQGRTTVIITDTTIVKHGGYIRSKDILPYE